MSAKQLHLVLNENTVTRPPREFSRFIRKALPDKKVRQTFWRWLGNHQRGRN